MAVVNARDSRYPSTIVRDGRQFRSLAHYNAYVAGSIGLREAVVLHGARPARSRNAGTADPEYLLRNYPPRT